MRRLFVAVARREGSLITQKALAEAMETTGATVTHLFGHAQDAEPLNQPPHRLGEFVRLFQQAGIPIEEHWLTVSLNEFERLLRESTPIDVRPVLSWPDAIRLHARAYAGLCLKRSTGLRLKVRGAQPTRQLERFHIAEPVSLALEVPEDFLDAGNGVFATVVHEAPHEIACLFPLKGANGGMIGGDMLRLPAALEEFYDVSGPPGVQRVHTILSRFRPTVAVHAGLEEIDLQLGLDRLASELSGRPAADWRLLSMAYQVAEARDAVGNTVPNEAPRP
jgi:hypothetical protein